MKRMSIGVVAIICALCASSLSQDQKAGEPPCGETGTQAEANACARLDHQRADAEMERVFERVLTELAGYGGGSQEKLRRAQTAWLQYRDANCESEASIYEGGSIRPAVYHSCLASVTRERAKRLEQFLAATAQ